MLNLYPFPNNELMVKLPTEITILFVVANISAPQEIYYIGCRINNIK